MVKRKITTQEKWVIDRILVNVREFLENGYQHIEIKKHFDGFTINPTKMTRISKMKEDTKDG